MDENGEVTEAGKSVPLPWALFTSALLKEKLVQTSLKIFPST